VAVANIQMVNLKAEVEKGSIGTVFVYGEAGPNRQVKIRFNYIFILSREREKG